MARALRDRPLDLSQQESIDPGNHVRVDRVAHGQGLRAGERFHLGAQVRRARHRKNGDPAWQRCVTPHHHTLHAKEERKKQERYYGSGVLSASMRIVFPDFVITSVDATDRRGAVSLSPISASVQVAAERTMPMADNSNCTALPGRVIRSAAAVAAHTQTTRNPTPAIVASSRTAFMNYVLWF
jgi:hypothetical protein